MAWWTELVATPKGARSRAAALRGQRASFPRTPRPSLCGRVAHMTAGLLWISIMRARPSGSSIILSTCAIAVAGSPIPGGTPAPPTPNTS
eukprot:4150291-Prymnesium_polylepis.1